MYLCFFLGCHIQAKHYEDLTVIFFFEEFFSVMDVSLQFLCIQRIGNITGKGIPFLSIIKSCFSYLLALEEFGDIIKIFQTCLQGCIPLINDQRKSGEYDKTSKLSCEKLAYFYLLIYFLYRSEDLSARSFLQIRGEWEGIPGRKINEQTSHIYKEIPQTTHKT